MANSKDGGKGEEQGNMSEKLATLTVSTFTHLMGFLKLTSSPKMVKLDVNNLTRGNLFNITCNLVNKILLDVFFY